MLYHTQAQSWNLEQGATVAVLPALGIGDALLMMIASQQLKLKGCQVTTFHHDLPQLSPWFPGHDLKTLPPPEQLIRALASYDFILVENDNSPKIKHLIDTYRQRLSIFYPTYSARKHAKCSLQDYIFDNTLPMADNIAVSIARLLDISSPSKENGISALNPSTHRSKKQQIILHPTSRVRTKNWKPKGFLAIAHKLRTKGFYPIFCVGPRERADWEFVSKEGFILADLPTLSSLAALVYESGFVIGNDSLIGHLASNLKVPALIIANDKKRMRLWRPGWHKAHLVLPPSYLPNWKFLRLREKKWQSFISTTKVLKQFDKLFLESSSCLKN